MVRFVRPFAAALALCCLAPLPPLLAPDAALAQSQPAAAPDEPLKQIALTDAQIQSYLAAAADIEPRARQGAAERNSASSTPRARRSSTPPPRSISSPRSRNTRTSPPTSAW